MYKDDGVSVRDIERLLKRFHRQPLDFFGALRASTYDNQIRDWIIHDVSAAAPAVWLGWADPRGGCSSWPPVACGAGSPALQCL